MKLFEESKASHISPLDLHLRRYFEAHKKVSSGDRAWIADHAYEAMRWQGILNHLNPAKPDWAHKLKTYFTNDRWRGLSTVESVPPSSRCSIPPALYDKLATTFGHHKATEIAFIYNEKPRTFLRVNTMVLSRDQAFKSLVSKSVPVEKSPTAPACLVVAEGGRVGELPEFKSGHFEIQDAASQQAALAVEAEPGNIVLDFCSGSGGKSLAFGPAMENKGRIYLYDPKERLLTAAKLRLRKAKIQNFKIISNKSELKKIKNKCDWVICDVPSTGTGVYRTCPELKWLYSDSKLEDFLKLQREIVSEAIEYLKPKGKLVYMTGSILPEENSEQVKYFCTHHDLWITKEPMHSLPQSKGANGWFAAVFEKKPKASHLK